MAIQVRRGNEADFDASKMLPGEWAVSLDTKYVRMCFAPGIVLRMASYESFEVDMELIQGILEECEEIQTAIERIKSEIDEKASLTIEYSNSASLSASRASEEADRAYGEAERAKNYAESAQSATNVQIATKDTAGIIKGGDNYIAEDGTLTLITETTETTMPNSCEGGLRFKEIKGKTEKATSTGKNVMPITDVTFTGTKQLTFETPIPAGTYTMSAEVVSSDTSSNLCRALFYNGTTELGCLFLARGSRANGTIIAKSEITSVLLYASESFVDSDGDTVTWGNIQIEAGDTMTVWEPYGVGTPFIRSVNISGIKTYDGNGNKSSVAFAQPIELNKIGDVQDVIVDGKPIRRLGDIVIDGSIAPYTVDTGNYGGTVVAYRYSEIGMGAVSTNRNINRICDNLQPPTTTTPADYKDCEINHWGFNNGDAKDDFFIFCIDENFTTSTEAQTWLSEHPIRVVFELETPVTEALPTADQIALNSVNTFDGTTYLEFDSLLQPEFVAEYGTSKVGGYTLEGMLAGRNGELMGKDYANRITALEATVVNNI